MAEAGRARENRNAAAGSTGRPRSEEAHQAILDATLELLVEVGFSALTVEGVAQRAGVGKATIYRRWASKLPLVVEAFSQLPGFEEVDTGSLDVDLKETLKSYLDVFHSTSLGAVFPSLAGERAHNPELSKLLEPVTKGRREPFVRIFERARSGRDCRNSRREPRGRSRRRTHLGGTLLSRPSPFSQDGGSDRRPGLVGNSATRVGARSRPFISNSGGAVRPSGFCPSDFAGSR
jgi:AcrR family transcriptional regulator